MGSSSQFPRIEWRQVWVVVAAGVVLLSRLDHSALADVCEWAGVGPDWFTASNWVDSVRPDDEDDRDKRADGAVDDGDAFRETGHAKNPRWSRESVSPSGVPSGGFASPERAETAPVGDTQF